MQSKKGAQLLAVSAGMARGCALAQGQLQAYHNYKPIRHRSEQLKVTAIQDRNLIRTDMTEEMVHKVFLWPVFGNGCL